MYHFSESLKSRMQWLPLIYRFYLVDEPFIGKESVTVMLNRAYVSLKLGQLNLCSNTYTNIFEYVKTVNV